MKNLKTFDELNERKFFPEDGDSKLPLVKEISDIVDLVDNKADRGSLDGPEWNKEFSKTLLKRGFEVFTGKQLKNFKLQEMDAIFGPEDYPGELFYMFEKGRMIQIGGGYTCTWEEFLEHYQHEYDSIIVARKDDDLEKFTHDPIA
jgi:hypothetical protein